MILVLYPLGPLEAEFAMMSSEPQKRRSLI